MGTRRPYLLAAPNEPLSFFPLSIPVAATGKPSPSRTKKFFIFHGFWAKYIRVNACIFICRHVHAKFCVSPPQSLPARGRVIFCGFNRRFFGIFAKMICFFVHINHICRRKESPLLCIFQRYISAEGIACNLFTYPFLQFYIIRKKI